ncbi:hypothetical protein FPQ18DRAFT_130842 [Pyronema domesticum]|uniref:DUF4140 domain-containing protein n=1 Tax=Pyronema omphalodes (strain CBS 100304) TaxID=1076935 RepID=U4KXX6_PYROM|nr:hypothetical protein FPQ18DRAFT_130842 [Pyronema domesticum]CCX06786.1 Similar to hypothetical protein [Tuber melanosporum Mel28]; acc. no. XP_002837048 [Pyronema omphalodes CBS 100304]
MSKLHTQTISLTNCPTRSITLYPTSALVVRDVPDIVVKPGTNIYTIRHFTRHLVPSSLRISGHGTSSVITDTSTILLSSPPDDEHFDSLASLESSLAAAKPHPKSVDLKQL